jgi:hypothetical protein
VGVGVGVGLGVGGVRVGVCVWVGGCARDEDACGTTSMLKRISAFSRPRRK